MPKTLSQPETSARPFTAAVTDGRPSRFFYFNDLPSRRLRPETLTREQALEQARALARAERDSGT